MTTYYVDIGTIGAWNTRNGQTSGACWYGLTGLQNAFDRATVTAPDVVYIKGTGNLNVNYTVTYDANSGDLTDGEAVTWHDGAGVVHFLGAMATPVQIELSSGNAPSDGDVVTGTTSTNTITAHTGVAKYTIDVNTNSGSVTTGWIKFIGCNASWVVDGTRAIITGNDLAGVHCLSFYGTTVDMIQLWNIECCNTGGTAKHGFEFLEPANASLLIFINCCAHNCSGNGWNSYYCAISSFYRCVSYSNTGSGWTWSINNRHFFCCARDNGVDGWEYAYSSQFYGCIAHGNTDDGIHVYAGYASIINSVIDGNGDDGIYNDDHSNAVAIEVLGSRITNHSGSGDIGINALNLPTITGWCYFEDNDGDNIQNTAVHQFIPIEGAATTSNVEDQADTDEGYVDRTNHDFSTDYVDGTDPSQRRTAITVPWS